jgi:hypothetical protein
VAEIELESEDDILLPPLFVEKEVTGEEKYYNSMLTINHYKSWSTGYPINDLIKNKAPLSERIDKRLDLLLAEQKAQGKQFLSDGDIDRIVKEVLDKELGKKYLAAEDIEQETSDTEGLLYSLTLVCEEMKDSNGKTFQTCKYLPVYDTLEDAREAQTVKPDSLIFALAK